MNLFYRLKKYTANTFLCAALLPLGTVIVTWNANSEADLKGYRIHFGNASRNYHTFRDVGNATEAILTDLAENVPYYFAVTAYDTAGNESGYSEEAFIILNPVGPGDTVRVSLNSYNFPNPFRAGQQVTNIHYSLPEASEVTIKIYDLGNSMVRTILDRTLKAAGEHIEDVWDGRDDSGNVVGNGDYFCEIRTAAFRHFIKVTVIN